jgi:hypothetical protein
LRWRTQENIKRKQATGSSPTFTATRLATKADCISNPEVNKLTVCNTDLTTSLSLLTDYVRPVTGNLRPKGATHRTLLRKYALNDEGSPRDGNPDRFPAAFIIAIFGQAPLESSIDAHLGRRPKFTGLVPATGSDVNLMVALCSLSCTKNR